MILNKLKEMIAEQFGIDIDNISETTDIVADLGADSLDIVEMMMTLEDEYGLVIDDETAKTLKTVGDVAGYIESRLD
ncbi:MAG: acyl carrier protein [Oscillospiraceae bacterium]|nr:acyl carrier protein [Oscillospiraceae bacterium]